jgi:hypothetical protein
MDGNKNGSLQVRRKSGNQLSNRLDSTSGGPNHYDVFRYHADWTISGQG